MTRGRLTIHSMGLIVCVCFCVCARWVNEREELAVFLNTVQSIQAKTHIAQKVQENLDKASFKCFCLNVKLFHLHVYTVVTMCDYLEHRVMTGTIHIFPSHNQRTHFNQKSMTNSSYLHCPSWMVHHTVTHFEAQPWNQHRNKRQHSSKNPHIASVSDLRLCAKNLPDKWWGVEKKRLLYQTVGKN